MGVRSPWLAFTGVHDGHGRSSTVVMVDAPTNPGQPTRWFVRSTPFAAVCPAPFFDTELAVAPGDAVHLRYAMVIADGTWVGVFDPKSNRNPTRYPLERTPLSLLLRERLSLAEPGLVLGATRDASGTDITVVDPRAPQEGRMVMSFSDSPVRLRQWEITTKTGQRTRVELLDYATGVRLSPSLFNLELAAADYR